MVMSAKSIADVLREACLRSVNLYLSPQTLDEIRRHLEGKSRQLSLEEIREWCQAKASMRDPVFIVPKDSNPFWITDPDDVCSFHEAVLTGRYSVWTGRPTESQMEKQQERRQA